MAAAARLTVLLLCLLALPLAAQPPKELPAQKPAEEVLFGKKLAPVAAASMIGQRSPFANVLILQYGAAVEGYWVLEPAVAQRVTAEVEMTMLRDVRDKSDFNAKVVETRGKQTVLAGDLGDLARDQRARDYLLTHARKVEPKDLARAAAKSISYANLFQEPARHRGVAVRLEGNLVFVRRFDPPASLRNDPDVKALYEAWIAHAEDLYNRNPYCVLLTELPKGIEPDDRIKKIPVRCDAYFFKVLLYEARASKPGAKPEWHYAPLLVGRTLELAGQEGAEDPASAWFRVVLPIIVASTFAVILVGGVLLLYFRRGDKAVNARLRQTRESMFVEPAPDQDPAAPPPPGEGPAPKTEKSEI